MRVKIICCFFLLIFAADIFADATRIISYQGKLTSPAGVGINGIYNMTFRFYDAPVGGTLLDSYVATGVNVNRGLFTCEIPLTLSRTEALGPLWMEIVVGTTVLTPRQRVNTEVVAMASVYADSATGVSWSGIWGMPPGFADGVDDLGFQRIRADGSPWLTDSATLVAGTNITLTQAGDSITISATGAGGGSLQDAYNIGDTIILSRNRAVVIRDTISTDDISALKVYGNDPDDAALYATNTGTGPAIFCSGHLQMSGTSTVRIFSAADINFRLDNGGGVGTTNNFRIRNDADAIVFDVNELGLMQVPAGDFDSINLGGVWRSTWPADGGGSLWTDHATNPYIYANNNEYVRVYDSDENMTIYAENNLAIGINQSVIYGRSSAANSSASSWAEGNANSSVKGWHNGGNFTASVIGYYTAYGEPSAAVLGSYYEGTDELGALGYNDGTYYIGVYGRQGENGNYAGYFDGNFHLTPQTTPTGIQGDIYANSTDHKLYFHNGISWVDLTNNGLNGSGTLNYIPLWTPDGNTIGNSRLRQDANQVLLLASGSGTMQSNLLVYCDQTSDKNAIFGGNLYGSSTAGTAWSHNNFGAGVYGLNEQNAAYHAGVVGSNYGDYGDHTAGVVGSNWTGTVYGALFYSLSDYQYGGYFKGGDYGIHSTATSATGLSCGLGSSASYTGSLNPSYTYGGYFVSNSTTQDQYGIYVNAQHTDTIGFNYGARIYATLVYGNSNTLYGTYSYAGRGGSNGSNYGVYGGAGTGTNVYGVYGHGTGGSSTYGVYFSGGLGGSGTKSAIVRTEDGPKAVYCQESPENWFEDFGSAVIRDGKCHVDIAADFLQTVTINDQYPMKLFIQLENTSYQYKLTKTHTGFDIEIIGEAPSELAFDYRVAAKRKGYEDIRLLDAPGAWSDHNLYPDIQDVPQEYRLDWIEIMPVELWDTEWFKYLTQEQVEKWNPEKRLRELEERRNHTAQEKFQAPVQDRPATSDSPNTK